MCDIKAEDLILRQKEMLATDYLETYLRMVQNQITAIFAHATKIYDSKIETTWRYTWTSDEDKRMNLDKLSL